MQIGFENIQKAIEEFNVPYTIHVQDEQVDKLLERLTEENVQPYEIVHYLYRHWGPDKLVKGILCSDKLWSDFLEYRKVRKVENSIRADLEKKRLSYLLSKDKSVREIVTSNLETFFVLFKYILSKMDEQEDLMELYEEGARYELKTMPELRKCFFEFLECYFPET